MRSDGGALQRACMICGSQAIVAYCHKSPAMYFRCADCSFIFQHPPPPPDDIRSYADTEYNGGLYQDYVRAREMKLEHFRQRLAAIRSHIARGRLLDVGCSCGYFLEVAAADGYDVQGLEFSANAIAAAAPHIRPRILRARVEEISQEKAESYDLISAFDIVEHLEHPLDFLSHARRLLRPGGRLVVSTPDAGHWLRPVMGVRWPMLQPMQHLSLFSRAALQVALTRAGFDAITITTAHKVLSCDYLIGQLRSLNPLLYRILSGAAHVIPDRIRRGWYRVNIGEMLGVATKTG